MKQNDVLLRLAKSAAIDGGDLAVAFREITEASSEALGLERVGVWFYADDTKDAMSSPDLFLRSKNEHTTAPLLSHTAFPTYFAWLARERAIPADDAHTHPATSELSEAYLTPLGIGALLDAPIRWHGKMVGLVCHEHVGPARTWTQDEINFAGSMADLVARAMEADARRKAQEELVLANRSLEARIAERTRELAARNEELGRMQRLKDEMFQNVSHELRTPLALILSPVERMLEKSTLTEEDRRRLGTVRSNALRLLGLVNDVLDLAKLETTSAIETRTMAVDVAAAVRALHTDIADAAASRGLTTTVNAPGTAFYTLDPRHLERAVLNLLSNAMKFTPAGGRIDISVIDGDGGLTIAVKDTGVGIAEKSLAAVFERFRQLDGGRSRKHAGTGIGLALVVELMKLVGGSVDVVSSPGAGSTFTLRFPAALRAKAAAPMDDAEVDALHRAVTRAAFQKEAAPARPSGERGPLVVLAEDEPDLRRELSEILSERCRVIACANGEEALEVAVARQPHVIVSDVMMPVMDGHELVRALRQRPELRDTAVVFISAKTELEDRVRGRSLGVDTYLTKPFHRKEVLATVEGLLRSRMRLIDHYLVHERLGAGSQSQVFRAEDVETGETVALKVLVSAGVDDTEPRARMARERRTLKTLSHPNIVRVVDEGPHTGGGHYIAMEYLEGETLTSLVRRDGPFSPDEVVTIGIALAEAVQVVHAAGLVHRDIKGSNAILTAGTGPLRERIRLIDFGTVYAPSRTITETDSLVGTLSYLAPELFAGVVPSPSTDIYALGVTLYLLATGHLPFTATSQAGIVEAIAHEAPPPLGTGNPAFEALVLQALAKDPVVRPASAEAFASALAALPSAAAERSGVRRGDDESTMLVRERAT